MLKVILQRGKNEIDDFDPEESELVEDIRNEVKYVIANYSMTENPIVKIREDN